MLLLKLIIHLLDRQRGKLGELVAPQIRFQIAIADIGVGVRGVRLYSWRNIGFQPKVQPVAKLYGAGIKIAAVVDLRHGLRELLPRFLLCLAVDGFTDQRSGFGIEAHAIPGFPAPVGPLPDVADAVCVAFCLFCQSYLAFLSDDLHLAVSV